MIRHGSIPAADPRRVARFLAKVLGGSAHPFPVVPGAWIAVAGDAVGTAVEVHADTQVLVPGHGAPGLPTESAPSPSPFGTAPHEVQFAPAPAARHTATHLAIDSPHDTPALLALAAAEGWRAVECDRGGGAFRLVELWLEDRLLIEAFDPANAAKVAAIMQTRALTQMFGDGA